MNFVISNNLNSSDEIERTIAEQDFFVTMVF